MLAQQETFFGKEKSFLFQKRGSSDKELFSVLAPTAMTITAIDGIWGCREFYNLNKNKWGEMEPLDET